MNRSRGSAEFGLIPRPFVLLSALSLGLLCVVLAGGAHPGENGADPKRADHGAPVAPAGDGRGQPGSPLSEAPLPGSPDAALPPALGQTSAAAPLPLSPSGSGPALGPSGKRAGGAGPVPREPVPPDLFAAAWPRPAAPPDPSTPAATSSSAGRQSPAASPPSARAPPARG